MSLAYKTIDSPVGRLKLVASDKGLVAVLWENDKPNRVRLGAMIADQRHPILLVTERQLEQYFACERKTFSVPLDMRGTSFQKNLWEALLAIPFGETRSYGNWQNNWGTQER
jgi:methylated-DNA-[protein]-cysteine S-methyltransferase